MKMIFAASLVATLVVASAVADPAGYTPISIYAPHHGRDVVGAVWYPTDGDGQVVTFADENPVFRGVDVIKEAPIQEGLHPVILLSHGMGGSIRSIAWLAKGLSEKGAVVVSVNHPNTTWGDFDLDVGLQHWTRVQDLSLALDALWGDPRFTGRLDRNRVMAAGFSFGGWTALSMGGLHGNHAGYVAHCEAYGEALMICNEMLMVGAEAWDASYADPRISNVVAIDPGLTWGVDASDAESLVENVRLIGLGEGEDRMLMTDFDKSGLAAILQDAQIDHIVPAHHFTAMLLCKPKGEAILLVLQDDPVCTDPSGTERESVHSMIIDSILADLNL